MKQGFTRTPNKERFLQTMKESIKPLRDLIRNSPVSAEVLYFLIDNMRKEDNAICVSQAVIASEINRSRSSIYKSITLLYENNWIDIVKIGNMNVYIVNSRVAWSQRQEKRPQALFTATVYADESEQVKDYIKELPLQKIPTRETLIKIQRNKWGVL